MSRAINLFRDDLRPPRVVLTAAAVGGASLALAGVLAVVSVLDGVALDDGQARNDAMRAAVAAMKATTAEYREQYKVSEPDQQLVARVQELSGQEGALAQLAAEVRSGTDREGDGVAARLRDLGRARQDGLWLERIMLEDGGARVSIEGRTLQASTVPDYVAALGRQGSLGRYRFAGLSMQADGDGLAFRLEGAGR